jgi:DNA-binding MarR family transcriptional regulator
MLLKEQVLDGIVRGEITEVYRNWKRPTVKAGGTLNTNVGQLAVLSVEQIPRAKLNAAAARRAGFATKADLIESLRPGSDRRLYRVRLKVAGEDPRIALREASVLSAAEIAELRQAFDRFDRNPVPSGLEPLALLRLIGDNEGVRAPDLADALGVETTWFKGRIRRLKSRGLTESLRIGYRLSPRGRAALDALR